LRSVDEILAGKLPALDFGVEPSSEFILNHGYFNSTVTVFCNWL